MVTARSQSVRGLKAVPRPQFDLKTLLWLTLVVAAALAGFSRGRSYERRELELERELSINERAKLELMEALLIRRKRLLDVEWSAGRQERQPTPGTGSQDQPIDTLGEHG
jgi:hypothetical protein